MKKIISYVLFSAGIILVGLAVFYAMHVSSPLSQGGVSTGVDVPAIVAGYPLAQAQSGDSALESLKQLHVVDIPLVSAIVAEYGQKNATLWIAEASNEAQASELIKSMEAKIAGSGSGFTPIGVFQFQNRDVYMLNGMGQMHFYVQSGSKVFWLATIPEKAEQAMKELLAFYP